MIEKTRSTPDSTSHLELEQKPSVWGDVTDPSDHNPDNYRYLVHAINLGAYDAFVESGTHLIGSGIPDDHAGDQSISLYRHPENLHMRKSLSMSLVDPEHTGTWGPAGLIVEVPSPNVLITDHYDAGAINHNVTMLRMQAEGRNLDTADGLLAKTTPGYRNEVVAIADLGDNDRARLKGFFYKVNEAGVLHDSVLTEAMIDHSKRLGLPVVPVVSEKPARSDSAPISTEEHEQHKTWLAGHIGRIATALGLSYKE